MIPERGFELRYSQPYMMIAKEAKQEQNSSLFLLLGVVVIVVGILARLGGAGGDLWLDEIWSLNLVTALQSPLEIITNLCSNLNFASPEIMNVTKEFVE